MKDFLASLEKLRKDAADAALIRDLATDSVKRETYDRLHQHYSRLASSGHLGDSQLNDRQLHPPWTPSSRSLEVERRFRLLASRRYRRR